MSEPKPYPPGERLTHTQSVLARVRSARRDLVEHFKADTGTWGSTVRVQLDEAIEVLEWLEADAEGRTFRDQTLP